MTATRTTPVIGIAGWKKSGKTTLTVRLIEEFTRRGLRVASMKHAHHEFQIDDGETDSARHRRAGAGQVALVGAKRWAIVHELREEPEPAFDEVLSWLAPADLVIVEGYKFAPIPKIEARRAQQLDKRPLTERDCGVIAIAADHAVTGEAVPVFDINDIGSIADFIARTILKTESQQVTELGSKPARLPPARDGEEELRHPVTPPRP